MEIIENFIVLKRIQLVYDTTESCVFIVEVCLGEVSCDHRKFSYGIVGKEEKTKQQLNISGSVCILSHAPGTPWGSW